MRRRDAAFAAVLRAAAAEARAGGDRYVGTEHLLLGLLSVPSSACGALAASGLDLPAARQALAAIDAEALASVGIDLRDLGLPPVATSVPAFRGRLPFTPGARAALERAAVASRRAPSRRPSPEDLLLALATAGPPDLAASLLARFGLTAAVIAGRFPPPPVARG